MKYKNIKTMLRAQLKSGQRQLWTWDQKKDHFTMIYEVFNPKDRIYTPTQLLEEIDKVIIENEKELKTE
jgi:hypothetical protein